MARIRTIKPSFFRSEDVSALPLRARLTWIGIWTQCDDQGRTKDNARLIKGDVWPLDDVTLRQIEEDLEVLAEAGRIVRYEANGTRYLEVVNWHDHQKPPKPTPSRIPPPPSSNGHEPLPNPSGSPTAGKGKEGKGKEGRDGGSSTEQEPPRKCLEHLNERNPPSCGNCADARRINEAWHAEKRQRIADAPKCRHHRGQPADNCAICRAEALGKEPA